MIGYLALAVATVAAVRGVWSPCGLSMLSSLNPVSERARGHRFGVTASWYLLGAAVGGAVLGLGCAALAAGVHALPGGTSWRWALVLVGGVIAAAADSPRVRFTLPVHPRQVDERWLGRYRRWIYAGGFGVQIGTGFATYIMSATVYLTAMLAALTGSPLTALLVGTVFGTVRGLAILLAGSARDAASLRRLLARVEGFAPLSLRLTCVSALATAAVALSRCVGHPLEIVAAFALVCAALAFGAWRSRPPSCSVAGRSSAAFTTVGSDASAM